MTREQRYTDELKKYDRNLLCRYEADGYYKIFVKSKRVVYYDVDGAHMGFVVPEEKFVCPLSEDWSMRTRPVEWGLLPLMEKIKRMDAMNKDADVHQMEEWERKHKESKDRDLANNAEAFASDFRSAFKKEFDYTLTHSMDKKEKTRRF